ncbi:MAG: DUF3822 family protein [Bacteroidia bacterium]
MINISSCGFEMATFGKDPLIIGRIGAITFPEAFKDATELGQYFSQFIGEFDLSKKNYNAIYINWLSPHFTLVPDSFYTPEQAGQLLDFNIGHTSGERIFTNDVAGAAKLVYSVPAELKNQLDKLFPKHDLKHSGYSSIGLFFTHFQLKNADVFLNIHAQNIELLIKKEKQLLLYNQFRVNSDEDILYYLLFSMEQFNLNPLTVKLSVAANRETGDELFKAIKKYIKQVNFVVSDKLIERKDVFESIPHHFYFTLLNRVLCE